jgi:hypothetical protein
VQWATTAGGTGYDEGRSITMTSTGGLLVTGTFAPAMGCSSSTSGCKAAFGTVELTSDGAHDLFVVRLETSDVITGVVSRGSNAAEQTYPYEEDGTLEGRELCY